MELQNHSAGAALLKLTGILMIVFGALGVLLYLAGLGVMLGALYVTKGVFSGGRDALGIALFLAAAAAELVSGILGVKAVKRQVRPGKAALVWGWLALLLSLAGMVLLALRATGTPLWELALGLALSAAVPVVYLCAARSLRRAESDGGNAEE